MEYGVGIREIRRIFKMSVEDLAIASGLTTESIGMFERLSEIPTVDDLDAIAVALGIPVSYIVMFSDQSDDPLVKKFKRVTRNLLNRCRVDVSKVNE